MDEHLLSKRSLQAAGLLIAHAGSDDSSGRLASGRLAGECSYASQPSTSGSETMNNERKCVSDG